MIIVSHQLEGKDDEPYKCEDREVEPCFSLMGQVVMSAIDLVVMVMTLVLSMRLELPVFNHMM